MDIKKTLMRPLLIAMFISLWITPAAFGWGELGHRLVAEYGTPLADAKALANCHTTSALLVAHASDPDKIWRQQRFMHPHEAEMHFFHIDRQPNDWRRRTSPQDTKQGRLIYHVIDFLDEAARQRKAGNWDKLSEILYGLVHYVGDLTQPLHLHHDYDGDEAGLPDLHAQFESKMLNRFETETRSGIKSRLAAEKIPEIWQTIPLRELIFDTAEQSSLKVARLFASANPAMGMPHQSRRHKSKRQPEPRFDKKLLWQHTGELAMNQLALGARLWAQVFNSVCR
ncbi:MAG: hypothetical protein HY074_12005 [Deltaproteobacteria bacterium]|nr:hypothetical protein [Deltaproteobacteria bacterium]